MPHPHPCCIIYSYFANKTALVRIVVAEMMGNEYLRSLYPTLAARQDDLPDVIAHTMLNGIRRSA